MELIDVHSHILPPSYLQGMEEAGTSSLKEDGFPSPSWSIEDHLAYMEKTHISHCILSISSPHIYFKDHKQSRELARRINEEVSIVCKRYPDQFSFAATLPSPDIQGCIDEAIYALDHLHAKAVKLPSNSLGIYLGDERFEPLLSVLDKRKAVVIIHPCRPSQMPEGVFTAKVAPLFEFIADTTRCVIDLIAQGRTAQYPHVKYVVPHCGSFLPFTASRLEGISKILVPKGLMEPVDVKKEIGKLYFDIAGDILPIALEDLLKMADPKHILFGGDFPYTPSSKIKQTLDQLQEYEAIKDLKEEIFYGNAKDLFHL